MRNGFGCEKCPASDECCFEYRGSSCSLLRDKHSVGDPLSFGDTLRQLDTHDLANYLVKVGACIKLCPASEVTCDSKDDGLCYECWRDHLTTPFSEVNSNERKN